MSGSSVFVSDGNVYIAGYVDDGTTHIARLWKNGVAIYLTDGVLDASANSVFVVE